MNNGEQLKNIFEANVRDYQGSTEVNEQIQQSLNDPGGEDFWWLNNGVTIVASQATQSGKTLSIEDPEVVNGLQTSTEIVNYFNRTSNSDKRKLLVRIIVPGKSESRDHIIKATNSQTKIPQASLRATDKVHRDIEEFFRPHSLYYDRRKNYYKNDGKPIDRIIGIPSLAQSGMSIFLQRPDNARARPSSLLKKDEDYKRLFNSDYPVNIYLFCAQVMRNVDAFLKSQIADMPLMDRNNLRFYIAMHATAMVAQTAHPTVTTLASLDIKSISDSTLQASTQIVRPLYETLGGNDQVAKGPDLLKDVLKDLEYRFPNPKLNGMT